MKCNSYVQNHQIQVEFDFGSGHIFNIHVVVLFFVEFAKRRCPNDNS